jgi:sulfite reductase (NADPH) flavoprotein alpha-component
MNTWTGDYRDAKRVFILTATHGDGDAPASASQFLTRLNTVGLKPDLPFAVLGLGDRQFPRFCQYAHQVHDAMVQAGGSPLLGLETVNRQSAQEFARWGLALGEVLGHELTLVHTPQQPQSHQLQLTERIVYGEQVNAPTHVLRFKAPGVLPDFLAGDLVGIFAPDNPVPRFYSLASSSEDGVLEICVRKHEGGVCSQFLHGLKIGAPIEAFIQPNPQFRPASGDHPVILIGAGTGIGPLAGFIRNNKARHPMHLYWGGRNPASDFLYEPELNRYLADHRLTALRPAFSQVQDRSYVQDRLISDALTLRALIENGAQVLVCGSREMAKGVMQALDNVLAPLHLSVLALKAQGRYREDVY